MHRPAWLEVGLVRSRKRIRNVDAKFADGAKTVNAMYSTDNAQAANLPKACRQTKCTLLAQCTVVCAARYQ